MDIDQVIIAFYWFNFKSTDDIMKQECHKEM